jgi:AraC-like DNA-binding protein
MDVSESRRSQGAAPPAVPSEFTTTDPAEAHAFLHAAYVDNTMRIAGSTDAFRLRHTRRDAGAFAVNWLSHTMAVEHFAQPLGHVLVGRVLVGKLERETDGETLRAATGDVFLIARPDRPYRAAWETMRLQLLRIDLADLPGVPDDLEFTSLQPRSRDGAQQLKRTINYACSAVLDKPDALANPLVVAAARRQLASAVVSAFCRPAEDARVAGYAASRPAALRRAIEFVEAHAHTDIGVTDIATAARVAPRTVQLIFKRQLGTTPSGYLRRVRLDRAHQELAAADALSEETVTRVRLRWGFADAARFASEYRRAYGVSPTQPQQR